MKSILSCIVGVVMGVLVFSGLSFFSPDTFHSPLGSFSVARFRPKTLEIPVIHLQADVEAVGKDKTGKMDVPVHTENVGWYSLGAAPGERGNVVIDGHYDSSNGKAVFFDLNNLKKGDIVTLSSDSKKVAYKVTEKNIYKDEEFPIEQFFGSTDKALLHLITCGGTFDKTAKNYSDRLVISAELVSS